MGASRVDVLVAGLGPAGTAAAAAAARAGLSVLAVDKRSRLGEPVQCAELVPLFMGRHARGAGVAIQRVDGMDTTLPSGAVESSSFPGLMIDRPSFDQSLAAEAEAAGARLEPGTLLDGQDAAERVAWLRPRRQGGSTGERRAVAYAVMVAADGPHSSVAAWMGLPPLPVVCTRQYTVPLCGRHGRTDIWLSAAYPGGYGWLFPKGTVANVGVGVDKRFQRDPKAPLDALLRRLATEGRVEERVLSRTGGSIPVGGLRSPLAREPVLFVGDAGGFTHPITGAGIAAAVIGGERAGHAAAEFLAGKRRAFEDFEEDLRDQFDTAFSRAVCARSFLEGHCGTRSAGRDDVLRRGWIAFEEYFAA